MSPKFDLRKIGDALIVPVVITLVPIAGAAAFHFGLGWNWIAAGIASVASFLLGMVVGLLCQ